MNLGTLVVGPREHLAAVADLDDSTIAELGPVLRDTARVVEALCRPEQTYVCLWSHGAGTRKHLHFAVQPVTTAVVARYGGIRAEQLQARMLASADEPDPGDVELFCEQARELFRAISDTKGRTSRCRVSKALPTTCWLSPGQCESGETLVTTTIKASSPICNHRLHSS